MKLPIIVSEHGDISLYDSIDKLERDLEPIDVKNGEFEVFDAEGKRLTLGTAIKSTSGLFGIGKINIEMTRVDLKSDGSLDEESLVNLLKNYLVDYVLPKSLIKKVTLQELIEVALIKDGYAK